MNEVTLKALESARDASDRTRGVLVTMQVACIVVFMAAWHEKPNGWTYARLHTAQAAVWFFDCSTRVHPELPAPQIASSREALAHDECDFVDEIKHHPPSGDCGKGYFRTPNMPFCEAELQRAKEFLGTRGFSPAQAREFLNSLQKSFVEKTMTVTVPFLGITLDANDLSLLGAVTFVLLLLLFLYSHRREGENLSLLFGSLQGTELAEAYRLLSMAQVFTMPSNPSDATRPSNTVWRWLPACLILTPAVVQLLVLWWDFRTIPAGIPISQLLTATALWGGLGLFVIILLMTAVCLREARRTHDRWESAHEQIQKTARAAASS